MKHILIVDDNKTNLTLAKNELSKNYQVTPVISGLQALQFLEKKSTDLILLDMSMPEMDGRETMQRIRANPQWANIPIIFLTADNSPETEAQCFDDGADEFIAKPFVPQVMQNRVSHILELYDLRQKTKELSKEDSYER
jgi:CheY-like chemotaxis protein